jgi:hypothetical protein
VRVRGWIASVALLTAVWPRATRAQDSPDAMQRPLAGIARVDLNGGMLFNPWYNEWSIGGTFAPFITEHWQVGAAALYAGHAAPGVSTAHGINVAAFANYQIGSSRRLRPYVGVYTNAGGMTSAPGEAWYGVHVGGNYFLSPFTALRAALSYRVRLGEQRDYWNRSDFVVTLDPYVRGRAASSELTPASLGTFDIAFTGWAELKPDRKYRVDATLAPFLTRWLQLGGGLHYFYRPATPDMGSTGARVFTGFARLYAPIRARTVPFIGGALESSTYADDVRGISNYRVLGGIRRQISPRAALDVNLAWWRYPERTYGTTRYRSPDRVAVQAKIVTQMRRGR